MIEVSDYTRFADSIVIDYTDDKGVFHVVDIPMNDFENFVVHSGWLNGDVVYDQVRDDTIEYGDCTFDEFLKFVLNKKHIKIFLETTKNVKV